MRVSSVFAVVVMTLGAIGGARAEWSFRGLGTVGDPPSESWANDVSADGSVVVGTTSFWPDPTAVIWRDGVIVNFASGLDPHDFYGNIPYGVSADGSVVVGASYAVVGSVPYAWYNLVLVHLPDPGGEKAIARDVSADGRVIVGWSTRKDDLSTEAVRWADGEPQWLGTLGYDDSRAEAVSADGSVIVGSAATAPSPSYHSQAFRWEDGTMVCLGTLGGTTSQATDVSADGSIVVGYSSTGATTQAFIWQDGAMLPVPDPVEKESQAYGISADGRSVVGMWRWKSGADQRNYAFLYRGGEVETIEELLETEGVTDAAGWQLTGATAISADGKTIVGSGLNPTGFREAWMVTIPEPSTAALLGMAAAALAAWVIRARKLPSFARVFR